MPSTQFVNEQVRESAAWTEATSSTETVKEHLRQQYTLALLGDNGSSHRLSRKLETLIELGYERRFLDGLPVNAVQHTFACGNPVACAQIGRGQVVLDIGSGAGLDCLAAAQEVGPEARVIGLDITPAMVEDARANARAAGKENVEFRCGDAESIPLESESVDWVISNGAICLTPDKKKVFREVMRVLRPGGGLSVSDLIYPSRPLRYLSLQLSGISAFASAEDYRRALAETGFADVRVHSTRSYQIEQAASLWGVRRVVGRLAHWGCHPLLRPFANRLLRGMGSVQIGARKPVGE